MEKNKGLGNPLNSKRFNSPHNEPPSSVVGSHNFAVANGCNVMVTPRMKGDEEVLDLKSLHKTAMIGTPEEIIPRMYYQELDVDEFSFWCDNSLPHAEKKKSLELFIKHVVPAFK